MILFANFLINAVFKFIYERKIVMSFELTKFKHPHFEKEPFLSAPEATLVKVEKDGVAPENYHAMSIYPEYFKVKDQWLLATESRMDCVPVINDGKNVDIVEFRNLKEGDLVVVGRSEDASEGIYVHSEGFSRQEGHKDVFAFRSGRSRETAYSRDYDEICDLLEHEKDNGYIVWVLGPAVVFDKSTREAFSSLISKGYANAVMAGNAMATHDLEGGLLRTALGQDIYTQESMPNGHYNHLDLINKARKHGSIEALIEKENIKDGIVHSCVKNNVPLVLAGSIRDDGPLPSVFANVYEAQDAMRFHTRRATTLICLATQLHTIASGNMTPSYTMKDGVIRPVFIYTIDITEFAVNKLMDRGSLEVKSIVTNVQDFVTKIEKKLK